MNDMNENMCGNKINLLAVNLLMTYPKNVMVLIEFKHINAVTNVFIRIIFFFCSSIFIYIKI